MKYYNRAGDALNAALYDAKQRLELECMNEVEILLVYEQTFSDTTLGRGGVGGQSICTALTSVLTDGSRVLIYRNHGFDYEASLGSDNARHEELWNAIQNREVPEFLRKHRVGGRLKPLESPNQ